MPNLEGALVILCNPLLDLSFNVDKDVLEKYGLKPNDAILAEERHAGLAEELMSTRDLTYTAGGAGQNTGRSAQWLLPPSSTVYIGCIGKDRFGKELRKEATNDGLTVEYLEDESAPTGTCICLITGKERSLVASLGAANNYRFDHILQDHLQERLKAASIFYITGFFLTVSPDTIIHVAKHASTHNKPFCMNLSAPFLCEFFQKPMLEALPYVDYLFANETEAACFAKVNGLGESLSMSEIALALSTFGTSSPSHVRGKPRIVVITQGSSPVICAVDGKVLEFPVKAVPLEDIVDTNGAGDAFVGGFLSQLVLGKPLGSCIAAGEFLAHTIIRRSGVTFPERPESTEF